MTTTDLSTINVICTGVTAKGAWLKSKSGNIRCFPISQLTVISGALEKGSDVTVSLPKWLLDAARTNSAGNTQNINFTAKVLVTGVLIDRSALALQVRCDADMVTRWFALSKISIDGDTPTVPGKAVKAFVPAWMLRHKAGHFPSWMAGSVIND